MTKLFILILTVLFALNNAYEHCEDLKPNYGKNHIPLKFKMLYLFKMKFIC